MDAASPSPPPEKSNHMELAVQRCVTARLKFWALVAGIPVLSLLVGLALLLAFQFWQVRKLTREVQALKNETVRLDQPVEIHNPAWGTVLDAVDPSRMPSRDARDPRYGGIIQ